MTVQTLTEDLGRFNWRVVVTGVAAGLVASFVAAHTLFAAPLGFAAPSSTDLMATAPSDTQATQADAAATTTTTRVQSGTRVRVVAATPEVTSAPAPTGTLIPAGTTFDVKIVTHVSSRDAKVGDAVTATTLENISSADGRILFPAGTTVTGRVVEVKPAVETRTAAVLRVAFHRIGGYATNLVMVTPDLAARARTANTAVDVGLVAGGAVAGAVIGHQIDHRRGSEIGAVVGGVTGAVAATNIGANVQLKSGETAQLRFAQNLSVN